MANINTIVARNLQSQSHTSAPPAPNNNTPTLSTARPNSQPNSQHGPQPQSPQTPQSPHSIPESVLHYSAFKDRQRRRMSLPMGRFSDRVQQSVRQRTTSNKSQSSTS